MKGFLLFCSILFLFGCTRTIGGDKDEHGCLIAGGYSWCEDKQSCIRRFEEPCNAREESAKSYCGKEGSVEVCGSYIKVNSAAPNGISRYYREDNTSISCPKVTPYQVNEVCKEILKQNCTFIC
ncbi:hypothetical protein C4573_00490 [Candidatus Woesearchaeota archaeon]|nr:MAG: hypothetical protein C4573_00490 [Candidatus Woesearchaeota archaeon]